MTKGMVFHWGRAQEESFSTLKDKLTHVPLLQFPNFGKTFELECDASGVDIGGVLMRDGKPVAYFSEKLHDPILKDESLAEAWERYHDFMIDRPTAGMEDWEFNQGFYCGLSQEAKENIDALAGGTFFMLNVKKA
jgi:hypothetical protein